MVANMFYLHFPEKHYWLEALGEKIQVLYSEKHSETIRTVKELNSLISTGAQAETGEHFPGTLQISHDSLRLSNFYKILSNV